MRIKICGINSPQAFDAAAEAGADWIGFVFFARSPRHVTPTTAARLSGRHSGGPARVGLFVNPSNDEVAATLAALPLDALQLYAPTHRLDEIRRRFGVSVWQSAGVASPADLPQPPAGAAALVIEPNPPAGSARPGGLALKLDWSMLRGWSPGIPWMLAGGLTPENVAEAIARSGAQAVDVSSGVETAPGVKDASRISAFVAAALATSQDTCPHPTKRTSAPIKTAS